MGRWLALLLLVLAAESGQAQSPANVLVVVNDNSPISRTIADYYMRRREIPARNLCHIHATTAQDIDRATYDREIAAPIGDFLKKHLLVDSILYVVTTLDVPLRIQRSRGLGGSQASVDSDLAALYFDLTQPKPHPVDGSLASPFFGKKNARFSHPAFPMYLVTRLAAYDLDGVKRIIDQSLRAANRGKVVIDGAAGEGEGNNRPPPGDTHLA